jgi:hypothetical protein
MAAIWPARPDHVATAEAEWPDNIISGLAVVYESGVIARAGETVRHAVDPDELAACRSPKHRLTASSHSARVKAASSATRRCSRSRFRRELGNGARP